MFQRVLISAMFFCIFCFLIYIYEPIGKLTFSMEVNTQIPDIFQLFYDCGNGYNEKDSIKTIVQGNGDFEIINFTLPIKMFRKIRIDPGTHMGDVIIKSISFQLKSKNIIFWNSQDIINKFKPLNQIDVFNENKGYVYIHSIGEDPYFECNFDIRDIIDPINIKNNVYKIPFLILSLILSISFFYILKTKYTMIIFIFIKENLFKIKNGLNSFGKIFSEDHLIIFDYKVILLLMVLLILFVITVSFNITSSSFAYWDNIVPQSNVKSSVVIGTPKGIRSDEWKEAPSYLYPVKYNLSVNSLFTLKYWGYLLFGTERGYAYYWNFIWFMIFIGFFLLLLLLTGNNFWLSLTGSIWFYLSAYNQWWSGCEIIVPFSFLFIGIVYFLFSTKKILILISSYIIVVFFLYFIRSLYPPWLVPAGYLLLFLFIGYNIQNYKFDYIKKNFIFKMILLTTGIILIGFLSYNYFISLKDEFMIINQTVYPGQRRSSGGIADGMNLIRYFGGYFNFFFRDNNFPRIYGNVCESSGFILLFPLAFILMLINTIQRKKNNFVAILLVVYILLISIWMLFGFPKFIAAITLFDRVPAIRAPFGLGIASIILTIIVLSQKDESISEKNKINENLIKNLIVIPLIVLLLILYGTLLIKFDSYYTLKKIIFIVIAISGISFFYLNNFKFLFCCSILFMVLPHIMVNPVNIGFDSIIKKNIIQFVLDIDHKDNQSKWIVYDDAVKSKFLKAGTQNIFNTKSYPDFNEMKILDPQNKYKDIWNRYSAFIIVNSDIISNDIIFILNQADLYSIKINPNSDLLKQLNIKYFVFENIPKDLDPKKFKQLNLNPFNKMYIFERTDLITDRN